MNSIVEDKGQVNELTFAKNLQHCTTNPNQIPIPIFTLGSARGFPELGDMIGRGIGVTVGSVLNHPKFLEDPHKVNKIFHNEIFI